MIWNEIRVIDNIFSSKFIIQTSEVVQGDPVNLLLFILAEEEILRITQNEDVILQAFNYRWYCNKFEKHFKIKKEETSCCRYEFEINIRNRYDGI